MRAVLIIVTLVAIVFILMVAYLYLNQRKMLYFPQGLDRSWEHIKVNAEFEYEFERDGVVLRGWLLNPHNERLVIYYGGNGEELSHNIEQYQRLADVAFLLVNYRGYGDSEGAPTEVNLVGDALAIFDELSKTYSSIVLMGRSLGSGVAVQVASKREVDTLILVTPYDSIAEVAQGIYPWAPISLLIKDPYDSLQASRDVHQKALFLIAEFDEIIPNQHSRKLADHWKGEFDWVLVEDANHNSITEFPAYWEALTKHLINKNGR